MLHPDRYSTTGVQVKKNGVVVHDSESADNSSASLISFLERPGDRPSGTGFYGSGYHAVTDGKGGYVEVGTAQMGPFHAPPLNKTWWAICMPGRASQTRNEWLDELSYNHIRGVAKYIVDKSRIDGFPLLKLNGAELVAGKKGYCSHKDVADGWKQTSHWDPGPNFPWDVLEMEIFNLIDPPTEPIESPVVTPILEPELPELPIYNEDDEMKPIRVRFKGYLNVFLLTSGGYIHLTGVLNEYFSQYPAVLSDAHTQGMKTALFQSGLTMHDMVAGGPMDTF